MKTLLGFIVCGVSVLSAISVHAQISAIRADFVRTSTNAESGQVTHIEHGYHLFSDDGRVRKDTFRGGEHVSEIVLPDDRASDGWRRLGELITVHHASREATRGVTDYFVQGPRSKDVPLLPCQGWREDPVGRAPTDGEQLGECAKGPLVLTGFLAAGTYGGGPVSYVTERWYFAETPTEDLAELRNRTSEGVVNEMRLTEIRRTTVPENTFDIPAGYHVIDLRELRRIRP